MDFGFILRDGLSIGLVWAIMAIGVFISYRILDIADLTAEGTFPLGAAVCAVCLNQGMGPIVAIIFAILAGVAAGIITALLHTHLKIPSLLAGIITMTGLYSINLRILSKATLHINSGIDNIFTAFNKLIGDNYWGKVTTLIIILAIIFGILYWFFGTQVGVAMRATGRNPKMAKAQGINTKIMIIIGLALSNGLIALSGAIFAQGMGYADVQLGRGTIVIGLVAIVLGEAIFGKRRFWNNLLSIILGAILYFILQAFALELGLNENDLKLLQALLIVIILAIPLLKPLLEKWKRRLKNKKSMKGMNNHA